MIKEKMTIKEIENLTEKEVLEHAEEFRKFKDYNVYFVDVSEIFGFSMLVFKNGRNIRHAHDYQLHHSRKSKEELRSLYLEEMQKTLFENADFEEVKDFYDYENKSKYLINIKPLEFDSVSVFNDRIKTMDTEKMFFSRICYCYFMEEEPVKEILELKKKLIVNLNRDFEYYKQAFSYQIANHEYCYNWQGTWEVCQAVMGTSIIYKGDVMDQEEELDDYMKQIGYGEEEKKMIKKAFYEALSEYEEKCEC